MKRALKSTLKKAGTSVQRLQAEERKANGTLKANKHTVRTRPLPEPAKPVVELASDEITHREANEYKTIIVTGSKGQKYEITVPKSYDVPKTWKWDAIKYRVADMIAEGIPIAQIAEDPSVGVSTRMTIYAWLEHPEFRKHVDALVMETGFANKRERIAGTSRVVRLLFEKIVNDLPALEITDKNTGAILTSFQALTKQMAQEKEEFVEEAKITQDTTLKGAVGVANLGDMDKLLSTLPEDERKALEAEFDKMGDEIIRSITGSSK